MPAFWQRIFGGSPKPPPRDLQRGPKLAGLDPISERAIALQKAYWSPAPDELAALEAIPASERSWPDALRRHHLLCLALLDTADGLLRRAMLAPIAERPSADLHEPALAPALERVRASARDLLRRRSPYRPRHGFAWLGDGPPEGDAIPYSDFQGRTIHASISHLGALEVITLDERHEPAALAFVPFDELMTVIAAAREPGVPQPPFRPARVLREYGLSEQVVLLPLRHGLTWFAHEPELLRGASEASEHAVAPIELEGLGDASMTRPGSLRPLALRVGLQRLEVLSDYAEEGLGSFRLADCYQLSLAIDQDDPRFVDKCRGRGIDPEATRGQVVQEARLRASARARKRE